MKLYIFEGGNAWCPTESTRCIVLANDKEKALQLANEYCKKLDCIPTFSLKLVETVELNEPKVILVEED